MGTNLIRKKLKIAFVEKTIPLFYLITIKLPEYMTPASPTHFTTY
jgi:hypothetical protein